MAKTYTADELDNLSKETVDAIVLSMQDQINRLNENMERLIEQIAEANNQRYGRSSEKLVVINGQLDLFFNEAEALKENLYVVEPGEDEVIMITRRKAKGKREKDLKDLPIEIISHTLSQERLEEIFGAKGWKQLRMKYIKESGLNQQSTRLKNITCLSMPEKPIRR